MMSSPPSSSCSHPSWFVLHFPPFFFFFFLISSQVSVRSAEDYQKYQSSCADYHSACGDVTIHSPFSDPRMAEECGPGIIDSVDNSAQLLTISKDDGSPYDFELKSINCSTNTVLVWDRNFSELIRRNNCDALYNFSLPRPSSSRPISFQLIQPAENITFQICEGRLTNPKSEYDKQGRDGVRACGENHVLRYYNSNQVSDSFPGLEGCKLLEFPADLSVEANGLLDRLSKGFRLQWHLLPATACAGGECPRNSNYNNNNNNILCSKDNQGQLLWAEDANHQGIVAKRNKAKVKKIIIIAIGSILTVMFTIVAIVIWYLGGKSSQDQLMMVFWKKRKNGNQNVEAFLRNYGSLAPKRYSYADIKKMTDSFKEKLGQGGYGSVFKGKLANGLLVAVKVLKASKGDGEEFINEVASIGKTSHLHIVTFLGFCLDGSKKALIYEFMSNGSLEKFIYNKKSAKTNTHLGWNRLYQIAVGIAKGLEYLHGGCNTQILHFDIKPHNILLDEDFCPKISDFGLAKLCHPKDSIISMAELRGTTGYIAPEVFSRNFGRVSSKSDIYSYGMMILEMVGGRKNFDKEVDHTSENYFPDWIYEHVKQNEYLNLDIVMGEEEEHIVRKMILVGLWCIQIDPKDRPPIRKVVEMLEGNLESLPMPPRPAFSSPPRELAESFSTSTS